jgi:poly-gamma-glutamate biosynthesis protein PgsC/CapC
MLSVDPLTLAIGIGLLVGLLFVDVFGLYAGGMVVPGYLALQLNNWVSVTLTLVTAFIIFAIMRIISRFLIIYGRRRIALIVLISFLLGTAFRALLSEYHVVSYLGGVYTIVGYIIPGLIALAMDRQGIIETLASLLTASVIVRLMLILLMGPGLVSV